MSRSITGQYVVTHPATKTVIVGDDLEATFERMRALTESEPAAANATEPAAPAPAATERARARMLPWIALALLPFVWLGALHLSLGRLVSELRAATPGASESTTVSELRARIERLERALEERPGGPRVRNKPLPSRPVATDDAKDDDTKADDEVDDAKTDDAKAEAKDDGDLEAED
ncbi:MAG TPA: hypothetical protein VG755_26560 [Nannocystaceae bacterium]|nr:hypothetical protein [Nannocystaceae bacterium]